MFLPLSLLCLMTNNNEILYLLLTNDGFGEDVNIGIGIWQHSDKNNEL